MQASRARQTHQRILCRSKSIQRVSKSLVGLVGSEFDRAYKQAEALRELSEQSRAAVEKQRPDN